MPAWKTTGSSATDNGLQELQCGHAVAGVEDQDGPGPAHELSPASMRPRRCRRGRPEPASPDPPAARPASMRPRRCRRGRQEEQGGDGDAEPASMRPRRCRRGRPGRHQRIAGRGRASMRPRRCRRGRRSCRRRQRAGRGSFNAATPLPAWKTSSRPTTRKLPCSCFNAATPLPAWKTWPGPAGRGSWGLASMRPRRCRRGRLRSTRRTWLPCSCFNAATPLPAWKTLNDLGVKDDWRELQCGHAVAGVEDGQAGRAAARNC